jgi:Tfp pilus assembly protein FimT
MGTMLSRKRSQNYTPPGGRGASLLEFTIILLFALPLLSATIDYGFGLRRLQVIAQAARLGVREAAATRAYVLCNSPNGGSDCRSTEYGANWEIVAGPQIDSVACLAKVTAYDFLNLAEHRRKTDPVEYDFTSQVYRSPPVDGKAPLIIELKISRKATSVGCAFCYANIFPNFTDTAESSMAVISSCSL